MCVGADNFVFSLGVEKENNSSQAPTTTAAAVLSPRPGSSRDWVCLGTGAGPVAAADRAAQGGARPVGPAV